MVCSLTADTFIARYKKSLLVYFVPHQPPQLPDHPPLVEAQTFTVYLLLSDLAFLPLLYLRRPRSSLVPPHSVYRRPEPASLFIITFELHTLSAAEPVLSCCCQPPHLACVAVLLCLQAAPPVTHTPTQVCWMPWSLFYSQEVEPWVSSGLSCLTKETGKKKIAWDFLVTWEEEEEVPGHSPAGRSALHPGFQRRATHGAPVQWLLHVPLSPAACRWKK